MANFADGLLGFVSRKISLSLMPFSEVEKTISPRAIGGFLVSVGSMVERKKFEEEPTVIELTAGVNFMPLDHPGGRAIARHIDRTNKQPDNPTIDSSRTPDNIIDLWDNRNQMEIESEIYQDIIDRHNEYLVRRVAAGKIGREKALGQLWTYRKWVQDVPSTAGKVGDRPAKTRLTQVGTDWSIGSLETIERLYKAKGWPYHHEQVRSNVDGHPLGYARPVLDNRKDQLEYYQLMHKVYTRAVKRLAATGAFHPVHGGLHVDEGGIPHYHCIFVPTGRTGKTGKLTESLNAALSNAATNLTGKAVGRGKPTLRVLRQAIDQSMIDDLSQLSGVDVQLERTQAGGGRSMAQHKAAKAVNSAIREEKWAKTALANRLEQERKADEAKRRADQEQRRAEQTRRFIQQSMDEWAENERRYNEHKKELAQQEKDLNEGHKKLTNLNNDLTKTLTANEQAKKKTEKLQQQYRHDYAVAHATSQQAAKATGLWLIDHKAQPGFLDTLSRWAQGQLTDQQLVQRLVKSAVSQLTQPQDDGPEL